MHLIKFPVRGRECGRRHCLLSGARQGAETVAHAAAKCWLLLTPPESSRQPSPTGEPLGATRSHCCTTSANSNNISYIYGRGQERLLNPNNLQHLAKKHTRTHTLKTQTTSVSNVLANRVSNRIDSPLGLEKIILLSILKDILGLFNPFKKTTICQKILLVFLNIS